jgi:hypothetical protein
VSSRCCMIRRVAAGLLVPVPRPTSHADRRSLIGYLSTERCDVLVVVPQRAAVIS